MTAAAEWSNFLSVQATAAATLTGLIFVAVSINLQKILAYSVAGRAAEAVILLSGVLLIASIALVPGQPDYVLGGEFITIGVPLWFMPLLSCVLRSGAAPVNRGGGWHCASPPVSSPPCRSSSPASGSSAACLGRCTG
jgi:hypothetical protein